MEATVYHTREWRELPRDGDCVVEFLFGAAAGPCGGAMHRHHVDETDPISRSVQACASHHPALQAALRQLRRPRWKTCHHTHRTPEAKVLCERRLNRVAA